MKQLKILTITTLIIGSFCGTMQAQEEPVGAEQAEASPAVEPVDSKAQKLLALLNDFIDIRRAFGGTSPVEKIIQEIETENLKNREEWARKGELIRDDLPIVNLFDVFTRINPINKTFFLKMHYLLDPLDSAIKNINNSGYTEQNALLIKNALIALQQLFTEYLEWKLPRSWILWHRRDLSNSISFFKKNPIVNENAKEANEYIIKALGILKQDFPQLF